MTFSASFLLPESGLAAASMAGSWVDPISGLAGLFLSAFVSATLLPGGSELVLLGLTQLHPEIRWAALLLASAGNTLGGMSTYLLARVLPERSRQRLSPRSLAWLQRWGSVALLVAWLPLVGDALCLAAGWLRLPWLPCLLWMGVGKTARYGLILAVGAG